jgi:hypothetical protein
MKVTVIRDRPSNSTSSKLNAAVPVDIFLEGVKVEILDIFPSTSFLHSLSDLHKSKSLKEQLDILKRFQGAASKWSLSISSTILVDNVSQVTLVTLAIQYLLTILDSNECEELWRSIFGALNALCGERQIQDLIYQYLYPWAEKLVLNDKTTNTVVILTIKSRNLLSYLLEEASLTRMLFGNTNESAFLLIRIVKSLVLYVSAEFSYLTQEKDISAVAVLHRSDHIVVAVRELIQLVPLLFGQQHRLKEITAQVMLVMSFLQKVSFDILSAGDANREACTSLGLVLGILIANPILEEYNNNFDINTNILAQICKLVEVEDQEAWIDWFKQLQVIPKIAVVRGILIATPVDVLVVRNSVGKSLLEGSLFDCIDQACRHSDNHIRLYALQGLETFITSAKKCCIPNTNTTKEKDSLFFPLSPLVLNGIASHVLSNWSHPFKRLSTMSTALFDQLLALVDVATSNTPEVNSNSNPPSVPVSATSLLLSVLGQPVGQVARYGALLRILPRVGARSMMAIRPGIIEEAFFAVAYSTEVGNIAGSFVLAFLASLRQEIEIVAGLIKGSGGVSSAVWIRGDLLARFSDEQDLKVKECLLSIPDTIQTFFSSLHFKDQSFKEFEEKCNTLRSLFLQTTLWPTLYLQSDLEFIKRVELELVHRLVYHFWSKHWRLSFISQLLHPYRDNRIRCSTHCANRLIGLDATRHYAMQDFLKDINVFVPHEFEINSENSCIGDDATSLVERKAWAKLQIVLSSRLAGGHVLEDEVLLPDKFLISYSDIARAASFPDIDARLFALEIICMTLSPSLMPSSHELGAASAWITSNLRACGIATDSRKRVCRSIGFLCDRLNNSLHQLQKASLSNEKKKKKKKTTSTDESLEVPNQDIYIETATNLVQYGSFFFTRVLTICSASLYPSAPFDRIILPLELFTLIADKLRSILYTTVHTSYKNNSIFSFPTSELLSDLDLPKLATALLNLCHSSHDRIRMFASSLLEKHVSIGKCFPCHLDVSSVSSLFSWALVLTQSPREREAAGGATLLNLLYARYINSLGWSIELDFSSLKNATKECSIVIIPADESCDFDIENRDKKSINFLASLTHLLDLRMAAFRLALQRLFGLVYTSSEKEAFDSEIKKLNGGKSTLVNVSPLAHGLVASLRLITLGLTNKQGSLWKKAISSIFLSIRAAQEMALRVVAGSEENDRNAGGPDAQSTVTLQSNDEFELVFKGRVDCPPTHLLNPGADIHALGRDHPKASINFQSSIKSNLNIEITEEDESAGQYDGQDAVGDSEIIGANATEKTSDMLEMSHMIVVASWLLVRECVEFQGGVISAHTLESNLNDNNINKTEIDSNIDDTEENNEWLISCEEIQVTGKLLLRSLLTLKHVGSIFACSEALQSICTKLYLTTGDINQLPTSWLNILLSRLTGASAAQFILRRSAGFSLAFVAILRSEPRNSAPVLLRKSLILLLFLSGNSIEDLSSDISGLEFFGTDIASLLSSSFQGITTAWRTQVHALNILRLLFRDGALGEDVGAFVPSALKTSLRGFKSKAWAVRNSSNMLFAAALERGLGIQSQKGDERLSSARGGVAEVDALGAGPYSREARNRPSVSQFFSRYPTMRNILLEELSAVTKDIETSIDASFAQTSSSSAQISTLFPILLLFAKMRPTASLMSTSANSGKYKDAHQSESNDSFLPHIKSAARVESASIRRVAARALAATLPPHRAGDLALLYISELPVGLDSRNDPGKSNNYIHGLLLQIRTLVTSLHEESGLILQGRKQNIMSIDIDINDKDDPLMHSFLTIQSIYSTLSQKLENWQPSSFFPDGLIQSAALELVRGVAEALYTAASGLDEKAKSFACIANKNALTVCKVGSSLLFDSKSFGSSLVLESCAEAAASSATCRLLFFCNSYVNSNVTSSITSDEDDYISDLRNLLSHSSEEIRLSSARALKRSIKHAAASVNSILLNSYSTRIQGIEAFESINAENIGAANTSIPILKRVLSQPLGLSLFQLILERLRSNETHPGVMRRLFRIAAMLGMSISSIKGKTWILSTLCKNSESKAEEIWSHLVKLYDITRDSSAKSQALILLGLITSSFVYSIQEDKENQHHHHHLLTESHRFLLEECITRIHTAAGNFGSFEVRNAAAICLSQFDSILLRIGLGQFFDSTIAAVACKLLWPRALELILDTDDEIREAARLAITTAMKYKFAIYEEGYNTLADTTAKILSRIPETLSHLLPPTVAYSSTNSENDDEIHHHNIDLPLVDEGNTLVLGIAALVCVFQESCEAINVTEEKRREEKKNLALSLSMNLASTILSVLSNGCLSIINGTNESITSLKEDIEGTRSNNEEVVLDIKNTTINEIQDSAVFFNTELLKRPMFQSDSTNEFAEPLIQGILFAAGWNVCCESIKDRDLISTKGLLFDSSALQLITLATQVITTASNIDIGLLIDPILSKEEPWIPIDGIDDAPSVFAGCRVAEVVLMSQDSL